MLVEGTPVLVGGGAVAVPTAGVPVEDCVAEPAAAGLPVFEAEAVTPGVREPGEADGDAVRVLVVFPAVVGVTCPGDAPSSSSPPVTTQVRRAATARTAPPAKAKRSVRSPERG